MNNKTSIQEILEAALGRGASDIHIKVGVKPVFRVQLELQETPFPEVNSASAEEYLIEITTEEQRKRFRDKLELDFVYSHEDLGRFRVNAYLELGNVSLVFRWIRADIPTFRELGLPDICAELAMKKSGLIILTGPTGCGKSTTLAAIINHMNHTVKRKIVTIEDPVEYLFESKKCLISQREVGGDTHSFAEALRHVIRQDPNVIVIGEMRDLESMSIGLAAAETGHLVLATLHTHSAAGAIEYLLGSFPAYQEEQIRLQLASTLQAVLYQTLLPRIDGEGVVLAVEVLIATTAIRQLIRDKTINQASTYMRAAKKSGMQTMEDAITDLQRRGKISGNLGWRPDSLPEYAERVGIGLP